MTEIADSEFPALFAHGTRKDWGVGVLSGVRDGKRTYLFEGGEERIMGSGAHDMMRKISPLDPDQQNTLARLTALVARRQGLPDASKAIGVMLLDQLANLRRVFPQGFADPAWQKEKRAASVRKSLLPDAKEQLSLKTLDAQLKAQQLDAVWASVSKILLATDWVPADELKSAPGLGLGLLAGAVRELLYGSATLEQRVDRFVVAYETACRRPPRWETATALLAVMFPDDHVLVDLASFRKQLKILGSKGTLPQRPTGPGYARCVNAARIIASKLIEHGEVPQDLLDIHDFIRFTLKPSPPARRPKAVKAPPKKARAAEVDDADPAEESGGDSD
ncbi:MAG TPA: hypothetical protein VJN18_25230 [Polyangiaceae bacterium]|nr:hypothetical protein [Polyangiaceae bacterium]